MTASRFHTPSNDDTPDKGYNIHYPKPAGITTPQELRFEELSLDDLVMETLQEQVLQELRTTLRAIEHESQYSMFTYGMYLLCHDGTCIRIICPSTSQLTPPYNQQEDISVGDFRAERIQVVDSVISFMLQKLWKDSDILPERSNCSSLRDGFDLVIWFEKSSDHYYEK